MNTDELREKYLSFFESKGCVRRPGRRSRNAASAKEGREGSPSLPF